MSYTSPEILIKITIIICVLLILRIAFTIIGSLMAKKEKEAGSARLKAMEIAEGEVEYELNDQSMVRHINNYDTAAKEKEIAYKKPFSGLCSVMDATIIALVLVFFIVEPFLLRVYRIDSSSMRPTLAKNYAVVTSPVPVRLHKFERGGIFTFYAPAAAGELEGSLDSSTYIKRLIGIPGDRIKIIAGDGLYLNGEFVEEDYILAPPAYNFPPTMPEIYWYYSPLDAKILESVYNAAIAPHLNETGEYVVPDGEYFMLGDNRNSSLDSHMFGAVSGSLINSKMLFIAWRSGF